METPLTQHIRQDGAPLYLKEYEQTGGYEALRKAVTMQPKEIMDLVKDSGLRGRGGAGFPTGMKWSFVPMGDKAPHPKYLVANGDEMEPGTFKDRLLIEGKPHQLIEGMIISAYAIEADVAYIFIRGEYTEGSAIVQKALSEAYEAGYLGKNILGSPYSLEMHIHTSVGRYMCGEETGLLNALEGKRATPRAKPPFPQSSGLFGKPTIVNNIETLSCIPHIINNGAEWFKKLSLTGEGGTKIYGASGKVKRPGLWELPLGTTVREILIDRAGGMRDGLKLRGFLPGGASTDFLTEEHLDVNMDFTAVGKVGSRMGTGTIIVMDDKTCPVGFVHNLEYFFAQESCGWCTPCREGLPWVEKTLRSIEEGTGQMEDLDILDFHTKYLGPGNTFCALAPGAMEPLQSALKYYRDDFIKHITEKRCPWRS
ncbi:MAG: NADH-quinone oxidoreductase subunit NuoF [Ignavibacteria bacterium]|jgi:NADH-quinone oxidoreductase subunit F|nr:NADH-quinone oxidoreductase subunit NuoF [Ignavibacteria bacterium]MCU7498458.1 NADH-quinone oxidoreductase subunit NuoF [Ignavibacteria bacterium]MCU7512644.1 NADH-quinone oxidoreductase subunit NuoF [Ignavibacteria bacterium]MCU7521252.1 NADH-quinone oxidoreductase subunit NuoF [Ignavibacteria bacterium]MCU7526011.1 NADH-quinone oxidoreductase subunit NuoF [Ignavibacteria bacterium]